MDRGLLNKATSADFDPVPGYTLSSISRMYTLTYSEYRIFSAGMTHDGSAVCKQIEEYLISKLGKDHSGVKYKVLHIIRYVCEQDGSVEFRRLIQRRADGIRQCLSFRGVQDPLRGDAPNKAVRDEAAAAMKALFAAENTVHSNSAHTVNALQSRIHGMGSTDFGSQLPPPSGSPSGMQSNSFTGQKRMESMGNPYFDNSPSRGSSPASLHAIMTSENPTKEILSAVSSGVQSAVESLTKAASPYMPASMMANHNTGTGYSSSMSSGPRFSQPAPSAYQSSNMGGVRSDWVPPKLDHATPTIAPYHDFATSSSPSTDEECSAIVSELCLSNPARVVPSQQSLTAFLQKASSVDGIALGLCLVQRLRDPSVQWTHKSKVLAGIDAVVAAGLDAVSQTVAQNGEAVMSLMSSPQCGSRAKQVCVALGLIEGTAGTARARLQVEESADLIEIGGDSQASDSLVNTQSVDTLLFELDDSSVPNPPSHGIAVVGGSDLLDLSPPTHPVATQPFPASQQAELSSLI